MSPNFGWFFVKFNYFYASFIYSIDLLRKLLTIPFLVDLHNEPIKLVDLDSRAHFVLHHLGHLEDDFCHDGHRSAFLQLHYNVVESYKKEQLERKHPLR